MKNTRSFTATINGRKYTGWKAYLMTTLFSPFIICAIVIALAFIFLVGLPLLFIGLLLASIGAIIFAFAWGYKKFTGKWPPFVTIEETESSTSFTIGN